MDGEGSADLITMMDFMEDSVYWMGFYMVESVVVYRILLFGSFLLAVVKKL